jgi:hypothetical protein
VVRILPPDKSDILKVSSVVGSARLGEAAEDPGKSSLEYLKDLKMSLDCTEFRRPEQTPRFFV